MQPKEDRADASRVWQCPRKLTEVRGNDGETGLLSLYTAASRLHWKGGARVTPVGSCSCLRWPPPSVRFDVAFSN